MADYPIPGAGVYGQAVEMAKTRYQQRLADINKQRQSTMRNAGFTADINDQGLISNMRTDPYNQYGAYQMLNRAQAQRFGSVEETNISRGLGTGGGLAAQNMSDARYQAGQEDAQFGSTFADQLAGLDRTQQDYKYEYDQALWQAQQLAAQQAIANEDYYPAEGSEYDDSWEDPLPQEDPAPATPPAAAPLRRVSGGFEQPRGSRTSSPPKFRAPVSKYAPKPQPKKTVPKRPPVKRRK